MRPSIDAAGLDLRSLNQKIREMAIEGPVTVTNPSHISGLGAGMREGEIVVEGSAGDYLGMLNSGASFTIEGDCGRFVGDGMTSGRIVVKGDVAEGAGEYCYGGEMTIMGNAGSFLGTMNKGASIVVKGNVGDDVATYMLSGKVIIVGEAGARLGNFLIGGTIYILGQMDGLGNNARIDKLRSEDVDMLAQVMGSIGVREEPRKFSKIIPSSSKPFYRKRGKEVN